MNTGSGSGQDDLVAAIEPLATPFQTPDDIAVVSMKLDAIVGILLRSSFVAERLGPDRVSELAKSSPELPVLLEEIGGEMFTLAAADAAELLTSGRASLIDFSEVSDANAARERLYVTIGEAVATIGD
jgi:hypothetical protein